MIVTATALVPMTSLLLNFGLNEITVRDVAVNKNLAGPYLPNLFFIRGLLFILFAGVIFTIVKMVGYPPETSVIIFIYCISYTLDELSSICFAIFNAHEIMEFSAALQTGRDLLNMLLSLVAITFKADLYLIVGISVLASLIKLIASLLIVKIKFAWPKFRIDLNLSLSIMKAAMPFAALLMISMFLQHVDTFILSLFRPVKEVGWYGSANLLINYMLLVPSVFLQAVFPVFARFNAAAPHELRNTYSLSFKYLLVLGIAMCAGIWVTADKVIELIFGPDFVEASLALRILSCLLLWMFGYANGSFLNATGGQFIATKYAGVGMVLAIGLSFLLTPRFGLVGAALARIFPGALFFLPLTFISHQRLGLTIPYGMVFKTVFAALMMAIAAYVGIENGLPFFFVILLIAPIVYGTCLLIVGVMDRSDIQRALMIFKREKIEKKDEPIIPN
jgi:O-antigen/teichoic acid export membrane protein